jgi:hypothetical protein
LALKVSKLRLQQAPVATDAVAMDSQAGQLFVNHRCHPLTVVTAILSAGRGRAPSEKKLAKAIWLSRNLVLKILRGTRLSAWAGLIVRFGCTGFRPLVGTFPGRHSDRDGVFHAAALPSLSTPRATIRIASSGNGRCSALEPSVTVIEERERHQIVERFASRLEPLATRAAGA